VAERLRTLARAARSIGTHPPVVNLRPDGDLRDRFPIVIGLGRIRRVLLRVAADLDDCNTAMRPTTRSRLLRLAILLDDWLRKPHQWIEYFSWLPPNR
jgi:hypothetical protein